MSSPEAMTFIEHRTRLASIASALQNQQNVDVEKIIADVRLAKESHTILAQRMDAAEAELNALFGQTDAPRPTIPHTTP